MLRKLGFKLSIIEAELNLIDAYKKKSVFQPKICSPLLFVREFSKHNHTQLFCWILYTYNILWICAGGELCAVRWGFCVFWAKEQFKVKMKLKQRKATRGSPAILAVSIKTQLYRYLYGNNKNQAILLISERKKEKNTVEDPYNLFVKM